MISKKSINAVELCLLLARHHGEYLSNNQISPGLGLSISYIENIIKPLKDSGIVNSMKGPGGGYKICSHFSSVSIWDVVSLFDKKLDDTEQNTSPVEPYEYELNAVIEKTLRGFALSEFVDVTSAKTIQSSPTTGQFKFKPIAPPLIPKAPNSVFQLHLSL